MSVLYQLARLVDALNAQIGRWVAWLAVVMVLVQFLVVLLRYVYGLGFIWMQESIMYMHALLFMVGAGYTFLMDDHVRVDVFYREMRPRRKALVDLLGCLIFLIPFCALIWIVSWPYVANSWAVFEGSKETSGLPTIYLLKSVILVFAVLMTLQALAVCARAILTLAGLEDAFGPRKDVLS